MADLEIGTMETHKNSQSSQTHLGEGLCRVPRSEKRLEMTPTQILLIREIQMLTYFPYY